MNLDVLATAIALLTSFSISVVMAVSLNLEYGLTGIPNFGKAMFVSFGAYIAGLTYTRLLPVFAGQPFIDPCGTQVAQALQLRVGIMQELPAVAFANFVITLLVSALFGGIVGYLASYVTRRLTQEWLLGLVLLAGSEIVRVVVRGYPPITCASNGLAGIAHPFSWIGEPRLASVLFALLTLAIAAATYYYAERLVRSPYGRLLRSVREDDQAARSMGKDTFRVRSQIMFIGSAIAALSGVLFAVNVGFVSTNDYALTLTLNIWIMLILGGLGNNRGVLIGVLIITLLDRLTAIVAIQLSMTNSGLEFNYVRHILFGVILLLMLRYRPSGLLPETTATTSSQRQMMAINARVSQQSEVEQ